LPEEAQLALPRKQLQIAATSSDLLKQQLLSLFQQPLLLLWRLNQMPMSVIMAACLLHSPQASSQICLLNA